MLAVAGSVAGAALFIAAALAAGVSGLSVGLGAVFLDLRQQNPAAIVSGFGGTLNLILNLGLMVAVILPFGALFPLRDAVPLGAASVQAWRMAVTGWVLLLSGGAVAVPMWSGYRSLKRREY